ncbi:hypothetical protein HK101_000240 [Irineochytrium annulatum]|nr:hypothetical protein HK101_000240 [Irineochytrium annulatum]
MTPPASPPRRRHAPGTALLLVAAILLLLCRPSIAVPAASPVPAPKNDLVTSFVYCMNANNFLDRLTWTSPFSSDTMVPSDCTAACGKSPDNYAALGLVIDKLFDWYKYVCYCIDNKHDKYTMQNIAKHANGASYCDQPCFDGSSSCGASDTSAWSIYALSAAPPPPPPPPPQPAPVTPVVVVPPPVVITPSVPANTPSTPVNTPAASPAAVTPAAPSDAATPNVNQPSASPVLVQGGGILGIGSGNSPDNISVPPAAMPSNSVSTPGTGTGSNAQPAQQQAGGAAPTTASPSSGQSGGSPKANPGSPSGAVTSSDSTSGSSVTLSSGVKAAIGLIAVLGVVALATGLLVLSRRRSGTIGAAGSGVDEKKGGDWAMVAMTKGAGGSWGRKNADAGSEKGEKATKGRPRSNGGPPPLAAMFDKCLCLISGLFWSTISLTRCQM